MPSTNFIRGNLFYYFYTSQEETTESVTMRTGPTEFEVQADAYERLKRNFPRVRGEVRICGKPGERGAVLDLLVLDEDNRWLFSVEVKRGGKKVKTTHSKTAHYEKLTGVPNVTISGIRDSQNILEIVERRLGIS